ncbi:MAG: helicase-exonuclease AddAB subunit AddB [Clostridiaceae bacterium]|nr:helicase-exonuclease AddAB subunit AddB [Clostridiaceae bacterium]
MSLRIVYGGAGSGKSTFCLKDIEKRIEEGFQGSLILIVPEQFSFQAEKNLIKILGEKGLLKAQVLSFKRMSHYVLNEVGGMTHVHINSAGKNILLHKVLEETKDELKFFAKAGRQKGFVNTLSDTITEFKRYNVTPELLKEAEAALSDEDLKNKITDINLIYSRFEELLHEKYIDPEDDLTILCEKLNESKSFDGAEIWIDEFSNFTPQQYKIIEKLLKKTKRINVTLNTNVLTGGNNVEVSDIFLSVKNTENKLLRIIAENNISYDKPMEIRGEVISRFMESMELQHLERNLFSYSNKPYAKENKDICIFKATNEYSEVESTARSIISLCREKGARFKDIALVVRDLGNYSNLIKVIFGQYDIPYFIDEKRTIDRNPLIILLKSIIDIFINNWSYDAVFAYLKTGLIRIEKEEIDLIENYVLANGIKGKKWFEEQWTYRLSYGFENQDISEKEADILLKVNEIKLRVVTPLVSLQTKVKGSKIIKDTCTSLYDFLIELSVPEQLEKWIENFKILGNNEKVSEYAQVWNMTMELLDQLVEVMGEEKVKLEDYLKLLETGINEYKVGLIPPSLDQVLVGSMERVKSHDVEMVYILGVNDGVFPMNADSEGILSDRDRLFLKNYGIEIAQDTKSRAREEQFLIYSTFTIPKKYLRVSYPISNFEGKSLRPSIMISRLKKVFPKLKEESNVIKKYTEDEALELISLPKPTFNELVYTVRGEVEGLVAKDIWWEVYRWYLKQDNWNLKSALAFEGLRYSNQVQSVNSQKIKKLYGSPLQFSVSRLEKFAECPFAYYVQYGLKAKERKIYELSAPDLGSFMHGVLDGFSTRLEENNINWRDIEKTWCENTVGEIVEADVNKKTGYILASSARYRYLVERLKRLLTKSVWTIAEHVKSGSFSPAGHEIEFGKSPEFPPITMELSSGDKISLTGRIDRVDEMITDEGTYLRIIDYKSGPKNFKLIDVYYGLQLQLLVYLDAILTHWKRYEDSETIPGAILYFKIDNPIISVEGETSSDEIEKEIMKKLKMQGLLLKDARIIREMDKNMEKYSLVIPAQLNTDGSLAKNTSAATREQFQLLREYVRNTVVSLCEEMLLGNITIMPCKRKEYIACTFCNYSAICKFDVAIRDNKYKLLIDKSEEELWELIKGSVEKKVGEK